MDSSFFKFVNTKSVKRKEGTEGGHTRLEHGNEL